MLAGHSAGSAYFFPFEWNISNTNYFNLFPASNYMLRFNNGNVRIEIVVQS